MLILPQEVLIRWNKRTKKYYEGKGYIFTKYGDNFFVDIEDLLDTNKFYVKLKCDYCDIEFERIYKYYNEQIKKDTIHKDSCPNCRGKKTKESNLQTYGIESVINLEITKEKIKKTNLNKFGCESSLQNKLVQEKIKNTMLEKYGVENYSQTDEYKEKTKKTNLVRYGFENPMQNDEVSSKAMQTFYKNGTTPTSSQQLEIYNQLKDNNYIVELNYPVSRCSLDIALYINNINIDIEYDAYHWHDTQKDRKRDEFLKSQGWKILRIKSGHKIPSLEQIQEGIFKLVNTDRTFTQIILDDWKDKKVI